MTIFFILLLCVAALFTLVIGAGLFDYHKSDAAGQGLTRAFTFFQAIVVAVALAGLLLMSATRAGFPALSGVVALVFYVAGVSALFVALHALGELASGDRFEPVLRLIALACPALLLLYSVWGFFLRERFPIPTLAAQLGIGIPLLLLSATAWIVMGPSHEAVTARQQARQKAFDEANARNQRLVDEMDALPENTPLAAYFRYAEYRDAPGVYSNVNVSGTALARMSKLPHRQTDAETLLQRGDTRVLRNLSNLELQVTPALCEGARKSLRQAAEELKPATPTTAFDDAALSPYTTAVGWLLDNKCDCKAEADALAQTIRLYPDSFDRKRTLDWLDYLQGKPNPYGEKR